MSLDVTTDPLVAAVGTLARVHVNAELQATLGEDAIRKVYSHPHPLSIASVFDLPALNVVRADETSRRAPLYDLGGRNATRYARVPLAITYITPPTSLEALDRRWPLLQNVWSRLFAALSEGYSVHAGGSEIYTAAGVIEFLPEGTTKREIYADASAGGAGIFPAFEARIELLTRDIVTPAELGPLLSILASYVLHDDTLGAPLPLVVDLISIPHRVYDGDDPVSDGDSPVIDG
jgi:hypothetical protein